MEKKVNELGELAQKFGAEVISASKDEIQVRIPIAGHQQPLGVLHGGANAFLVEDAGSRLAWLYAPDGRFAVGTELSMSNLRPGTGDYATAHATPIFAGGSSFVARVEIYTDDGTHIASGRMTSVFVKIPAEYLDEYRRAVSE
ncbi:MAG: PaaI family thioesterase [Trueperella sp.]|nr:PaaI family thioesterase [Trueperella sp.]